MKKFLYTLVMVILVCIFAYAGYQVYLSLNDYHIIDEYYETASKYVVSAPPEPTREAEPEKNTEQPVAESIIETEIETEVYIETAPIAIDFALLLQDCPDSIGWLYAPDGSICLPVVQGIDNERYLNRLPDGTYSKGGSLFLDYINASDFTDEISFIYGHNMKNNTMLQPILQYKKQDYYDLNPVLYLLTPTQNYKMELFAGVLTDMDSDIYRFSFLSPEEKQEFIDDLVLKSTFTSDHVPDTDATLLCLSTCAYDYNDARYILAGSLTPIG